MDPQIHWLQQYLPMLLGSFSSGCQGSLLGVCWVGIVGLPLHDQWSRLRLWSFEYSVFKWSLYVYHIPPSRETSVCLSASPFHQHGPATLGIVASALSSGRCRWKNGRLKLGQWRGWSRCEVRRKVGVFHSISSGWDGGVGWLFSTGFMHCFGHILRKRCKKSEPDKLSQ